MAHQTVVQFLSSLRPALPWSADRQCMIMSGSELRKHLNAGLVHINGWPVEPNEPMDFPVFKIVFFPNSKRKTTLL